MWYSGGHEYFLFKTRKKQSDKWQTAVTQTKAKTQVSFLFR